jgi:PiT family inorganic phosphate transporter
MTDVDLVLLAVIAVVALALLFDFSNGFHDAANSIATVVATRVMAPRRAVWFSAVCNFAGILLGTSVANTVAKTVEHGYESVAVVFAALIAAIAWNYATWFIGMPSSSSHAIIGGLVGAGLAAGGLDAIHWSSVQKVLIAIILSPLVAFGVAALATWFVNGLARATNLKDDARPFKVAQLVSAAAVSVGHGANDAQKTMGVIAALLAGAGYLQVGADGSFAVPLWVELAAYTAIAAGTVWGGWRIIETVGLKITKLNPRVAVGANLGAVTSIFGATDAGIPISTTHASTSSVVGAGVAARTGTNWKVVGEMVTAWVVTLPTTCFAGYAMFKLTALPRPWAGIAVTLVVVPLLAWIAFVMVRAQGAKAMEAELIEADLGPGVARSTGVVKPQIPAA